MKTVVMLVVFLAYFGGASAVNERTVKALTEEEYDILVRIITNCFETPVVDRTALQKPVIRKYQRWIKQGKIYQYAFNTG